MCRDMKTNIHIFWLTACFFSLALTLTLSLPFFLTRSSGAHLIQISIAKLWFLCQKIFVDFFAVCVISDKIILQLILFKFTRLKERKRREKK